MFGRKKKVAYLCEQFSSHYRNFRGRRVSAGAILGSYQSGQMGLTVTQLATPSVVRIHHCPPLSPNGWRSLLWWIVDFFAEVAQLIEHQPSKLRVAGLSPVFRSLFIAYVAQW